MGPLVSHVPLNILKSIQYPWNEIGKCHKNSAKIRKLFLTVPLKILWNFTKVSHIQKTFQGLPYESFDL